MLRFLKLPQEALENSSVVKCRNCSGDHWTSKYPYKDTVLAGDKVPDDKKPLINSNVAGAMTELKPQGSKYIPPNMQDGASKRGDSLQPPRRDDHAAIRISNLSESTTDADLHELVKPFGAILKRYLAKHKTTKLCKGFAFVHFKHRADAAEAISALNGYCYDHLILSVNWSKPPTQNT